jgi:zinc D-Ala-D-Ala dipeptidase
VKENPPFSELVLPELLPPIPDIAQSLDTAHYRHIRVDLDSPYNSEPLVRLQDYRIATHSYYNVSDGTNPPYCQQIDGSISSVLARRSVAEMLARVNIRLDLLGLELLVWDAYRPLATQKGIWDFFWHDIKAKNASLSEEAIYNIMIGYVSDPNSFDPDDSTTWPTHMTGASVDLTLRRKNDLRILDMGSEFDQMDETAHTAYFERLHSMGVIRDDDIRLKGRRLLYSAMAEEGFTNYPLEYWHFDWGNQMHFLIRSLTGGRRNLKAFYGVV